MDFFYSFLRFKEIKILNAYSPSLSILSTVNWVRYPAIPSVTFFSTLKLDNSFLVRTPNILSSSPAL